MFALGIHEDTGSLTYPTSTLRDAEALAWCLRHGARQEMVAQYLHTPLAVERARAPRRASGRARDDEPSGASSCCSPRIAWPRYVDGVSNLAHKLVDLTDCRGLVCLVEMEGRVVCVVRSRLVRARRLRGRGRAGRRRARAGGVGLVPRIARGSPGADARGAPGGRAGRRRPPVEIMSRPARFVSPEDTVAHAMVLCQRHRQSGIQVGEPA